MSDESDMSVSETGGLAEHSPPTAETPITPAAGADTAPTAPSDQSLMLQLMQKVDNLATTVNAVQTEIVNVNNRMDTFDDKLSKSKLKQMMHDQQFDEVAEPL
ncbi:unnamed protein product [[Candida] boidinii]|nr:unnamed protein product [[Candida] boidinii]